MSDKLQPAEILANPENLKCTCPELDCEWRNNCKDCVALHRYYESVPSCLERVLEKAEA